MIEDNYILVVEDDFDLLWLIRKILDMHGFRVISAVTAGQAIDSFSRNLFKIKAVILDLTLPDENGQFIVQEFKKVAPQIPIIITTGSEDRTQKRKLEKEGISAYLIKPFDIMRLIETLSKLLL